MTAIWWRGLMLDVDELLAGRGWPEERLLQCALMETKRFGGVGISVWEHSMRVSTRAESILHSEHPSLTRGTYAAQLIRAALWHDAAEAITGDVIAPVRHSLGGYIDRALDDWQAAAALALGLARDPLTTEIVNRADREVGAEELVTLKRKWWER